MSAAKVMEARAVQYELEIEFNAPPQRVWRGLTDQLNDWWPPDSHVLGEGSVITLEPHAGGRFYEQRGERELLWFTVLDVAPGQSLSLAGFCTPQWGGPATTLVTFTLEAKGDGTLLRMTDALFGYVPDKSVKSQRGGWTQLLEQGLKKFLET